MCITNRLGPGMLGVALAKLVLPAHRCAGKHGLPTASLVPKDEELPRENKGTSIFFAQSFGSFSSFLAIVAALTIGFPQEPFAQAPKPSSHLAFNHALRLAEERSVSLQAEDAKGRASRERAVSASHLPDPVLRLSVDNLPATGSSRFNLTDDFMTMRSVGVTQTFIGSEKRNARRDRFEREAELAVSMRSVELAKLQTETALAWFERHYQQRILDLLEREREEAVFTTEAVYTAYRSGRGAQADVFAAKEEIARIGNRIHETRADISNSITLLARWIGDSARLPLGAAPTVSKTSWDGRDIAHQVDLHPQIQALHSREQVALAQVNVAKAEKNADWSLSLMFSRRGDNFSDMVSIGASVPLQWNQKNRQDRELAARLEEVSVIRANREEIRRGLHSDVERMLATWRANLRRMQDYDRSITPLAIKGTNAALATYRGGKGPLADVLEARRMELSAQLERLRIEKQTAAIWAWLEFLIPESESSTDAIISKSEKAPGN